MKRFSLAGALIVWGCLACIAASQERGAQDKQDKQEKKDADPKSQDLLARVSRNMESSEDRLKKTDPGDVTRKIQRDIIDDLDELIKQSKDQQQQSGGSGRPDKFSKPDRNPSPKKGGDPKGGQQKQGEMKGPSQAKPAPGEKGQGKDKDKGKGEGEKEGDSKTGGKEGKDKEKDKGQAKGQGEDGEGGGTAKKNTPPKTDLLADQNRSEWGHLPQTKRQEMDAYAKQRFMPRYDDVLQEYYRTVSEQAQRKK